MKYALVTGGSRGLGKAICLKLSSLGYSVIVNFQSNHAAAEEVKASIENMGGHVELLKFDVRSKEEIDKYLCESFGASKVLWLPRDR